MFSFSKLPANIKSSILMHIAGLFAILSLTFLLGHFILSGQCALVINKIIRLDPYKGYFDKYLEEHNKKYDHEEYYERLENFKRSLIRINQMNEQTEHSNPYGLTKFSDMSDEEFEGKMLMRCFHEVALNSDDDIDKNCSIFWKGYDRHDGRNLPMSVDWRNYKKRVIGPVLDQGSCASCWAFSIVGVMESMLAITKPNKSYTRLSIQELTDCSNDTDKCNCGHPALALKYICNYKIPITTERQYPLTNRLENCYNIPKSGVVVSSYSLRYNIKDVDIMRIIAFHGPVVAVVNAQSWINYNGNGIIERHCDGSMYSLNHVVQIVGYDMSAPLPHYILRNSWGKDFGDNGYLRVAMGQDYLCGIGRHISFMDVDEI